MNFGLAIWHYPHRTVLENVDFFHENGFDAESLLGEHFVNTLRNPEEAEALADKIRAHGTVLTVHHKLPGDHSAEKVETFEEEMRLVGNWQKKHGLITVLSFDVAEAIRDNIVPYIRYTLEQVPGCRVAVEDFGLTDEEAAQTEIMKQDPRFGYLIDLGHMYIRLNGKNTSGHRLFTPSMLEGTGDITSAGFLKALQSKNAPVVEVHFHNNDGISDQHLFLEDGNLDMREPLKALRDFGFSGVLTIESAPGFVFKCYGQEADDGILKTYNTFKQMAEEIL